jgi:hypothetical protein
MKNETKKTKYKYLLHDHVTFSLLCGCELVRQKASVHSGFNALRVIEQMTVFNVTFPE